METKRPRITRPISKTRSTPRLRWPVSEKYRPSRSPTLIADNHHAENFGPLTEPAGPFSKTFRRQGAGCEGRLGLKKPVQNLIMETPPVLCTIGWRVAEPSLAWSEAVGPRLIHQPGPDQRLFNFDDVMIHPYAVLGFLVFCAAAAWTMAL